MRLFVVEDDRDTSAGVCRYFRESGYEVFPVYDGEETLA
jgi:two-component system response regulator VanR